MQTVFPPTTQDAPTVAGCRPRGTVVAEELPELLAAFVAREDIRGAAGPIADLAAAATRLDRARLAIRAC
ncbi:MAG: hypothetical protein KY457_10320 [Actinobacteria bacterium]|nr:hypothetical protein [Actinomycetota bacterium]